MTVAGRPATSRAATRLSGTDKNARGTGLGDVSGDARPDLSVTTGRSDVIVYGVSGRPAALAIGNLGSGGLARLGPRPCCSWGRTPTS